MSWSTTSAFEREAETRYFDYSEEFRLKVSVDYRRFIFISPKRQIKIEDILGVARMQRGFEAHRVVRKGKTIVHMYVRYQTAECAAKAEPTFNHDDLNVAHVSTMLEAMYDTEYSNRQFPVWTPTLVDTVGPVRHSDPLARGVVERVLQRLGEPRVFDFRGDGDRITTVQALFSSMAEALGASIVHGTWIYEDDSSDIFSYRVRIVGGEKERFLMRRLRIPNPETVFEMEYFLHSDSVSTNPPLLSKPAPHQNNNEPTRALKESNTEEHQQRPVHSFQRGGGGYKPRGARRGYGRKQYSNRNNQRQLRYPGQEYGKPEPGK